MKNYYRLNKAKQNVAIELSRVREYAREYRRALKVGDKGEMEMSLMRINSGGFFYKMAVEELKHYERGFN